MNPNSLLQPKKSQKGPQNFVKFKVRIEIIIENTNCLTTCVDPKTSLNLTLSPKIAQNDPEIRQKQKNVNKGSTEIKFFQLYD